MCRFHDVIDIYESLVLGLAASVNNPGSPNALLALRALLKDCEAFSISGKVPQDLRSVLESIDPTIMDGYCHQDEASKKDGTYPKNAPTSNVVAFAKGSNAIN